MKWVEVFNKEKDNFSLIENYFTKKFYFKDVISKCYHNPSYLKA